MSEDVKRVGDLVCVTRGAVTRCKTYGTPSDAEKAVRRLVAEKSARERFLRSKR